MNFKQNKQAIYAQQPMNQKTPILKLKYITINKNEMTKGCIHERRLLLSSLNRS